jgi:hypothetical protein
MPEDMRVGASGARNLDQVFADNPLQRSRRQATTAMVEE